MKERKKEKEDIRTWPFTFCLVSSRTLSNILAKPEPIVNDMHMCL